MAGNAVKSATTTTTATTTNYAQIQQISNAERFGFLAHMRQKSPTTIPFCQDTYLADFVLHISSRRGALE